MRPWRHIYLSVVLKLPCYSAVFKGVCVNSNVNEKKTLRIKLVVREVIDKMFIV